MSLSFSLTPRERDLTGKPVALETEFPTLRRTRKATIVGPQRGTFFDSPHQDKKREGTIRDDTMRNGELQLAGALAIAGAGAGAT